MAHVQLLGEVHDILADIFYGLAVLGLDGDISIGNESAEVQCHLGSVIGISHCRSLEELGPVWLGIELVDGRKKLARHGNRKSFQPHGLFDLLLCHGIPGCVASAGSKETNKG